MVVSFFLGLRGLAEPKFFWFLVFLQLQKTKKQSEKIKQSYHFSLFLTVSLFFKCFFVV